ncbi:MAG: hypothetical protein JNL74_12060, partial [Fibrobacteres bacterium]|nr:hypothetical protein [Fibrobacterota bacterium]
MKIITAVLLCAALSFSYQAQRDTLEPTDSISVSPLSGLRYINLLVNSNSSSTFLFQVDGDSSVEKVSYFGNNLANYVCNVESAKKKISEYKTLRFAQTGLLISGIVLTAIGTTFTIQ